MVGNRGVGRTDIRWLEDARDDNERAFETRCERHGNRSSRMDLHKNDDGSVDIYCRPKPPAGFEKNWIPTVPGKNWFAYFRFYRPTEPYFDRSWPLSDFEPL
jgi:hypothetical protein